MCGRKRHLLHGMTMAQRQGLNLEEVAVFHDALDVLVSYQPILGYKLRNKLVLAKAIAFWSRRCCCCWGCL